MIAGRRIVVLGLSLSSSWGNGHATTYRALLKGLNGLGHQVLFLERDVPWYAAHRDLPAPDFCDLAFYDDVADLAGRLADPIAQADAVVVGSYVPDGVAVLDAVRRIATGTLAFYDIDTPVTLAKLARGDEEYLARRQIPDLDLYLSFTGGPTLRRLEQAFGARRAAPLYCCADDALGHVPQVRSRWDLGYLGTYSPDRQPTLERLLLEPARRLPHRRFVVAGPQYPAGIDWPANVERIEHCPPADHPAFYGAQRWTLNVTRADMIAAGWSPSVRLFEAASCGTPIVSDVWPGIEEVFAPDRAIILARTTDDVVALLEHADADRHQAVARAARAEVLRRHTGTARARDLIRELDAGAHSRTPPVARPDRAADRAEVA